jgi:uncharacterized protein (DUF58 family)
MEESVSRDVELSWRASPLARSLATCVAITLALAVIGSRWHLIAFAAALLGVLITLRWQRPVPKVSVHAEPGMWRCFEGEQVELTVWTSTNGAAGVTSTVSVVQPMRLEVVDPLAPRLVVRVSADRWGRYPIVMRVSVAACGGLLEGAASVSVADVFVFPVAPAQSTAIPRTELPDRLGAHITRRIGRGVEFGNIRAYVPGDQLRTVNWPVSARRGSLQVTERLSERAADVVVLVDTHDQPAGPATESTERTVRGAVQVVQSALRSGDRAGVVALGGQPRWLGPDIGRRQFYRVLDATLGAGAGFETTTGTLAPRPAVPVGAVVVAFSTLLDTDFALALIDLCRRGHVVVAVDVLDGIPFAGSVDPLVGRMWSMQRSFMYRDMATVGVDIVAWRGDSPLDQVMHLIPDRRRRMSRRGLSRTT